VSLTFSCTGGGGREKRSGEDLKKRRGQDRARKMSSIYIVMIRGWGIGKERSRLSTKFEEEGHRWERVHKSRGNSMGRDEKMKKKSPINLTGAVT